jgi:DNA replication ATP-dependent helicase Dna2
MLTTTYRMNDLINEFPSKVFYGGRLRPSASAGPARFEPVPGGPFDEIFDAGRPAVLARIDYEGFRTRSEPEARAVADMAADLLVRQKVQLAEMAIVSPYRAQLRIIYTMLRERVPGGRLPVIDTVERIQGQERKLLIVSLASSDPDYLSGSQADFFFSPNRLNVTLTRARTKLVVAASRHLFTAVPRKLEQLCNADLFRRLYAELPQTDLSERYLGRQVEA